MSESTEELQTAVQGLSEVLAESENLAGQLSDHGKEFAEEAAAHGWHGVAGRMQEATDALQAATGQLAAGKQACENAAQELALITDQIPAEQVVNHLATSTTQLSEAVTSVGGALEKVDEARTAANEIGQQGMMQATSDFHDRLEEVHETITQHQTTSETERVAAEAYAAKQLGN